MIERFTYFLYLLFYKCYKVCPATSCGPCTVKNIIVWRFKIRIVEKCNKVCVIAKSIVILLIFSISCSFKKLVK